MSYSNVTSKNSVGVPTQQYPGQNYRHSAPRPGHGNYYLAQEDLNQGNRRPRAPLQRPQRHPSPVPSNSPGVPSPSASPGVARTSPHDMSKQGVLRHPVSQPVNIGAQGPGSHQGLMLNQQYTVPPGRVHAGGQQVFRVRNQVQQNPAMLQQPGGGNPVPQSGATPPQFIPNQLNAQIFQPQMYPANMYAARPPYGTPPTFQMAQYIPNAAQQYYQPQPQMQPANYYPQVTPGTQMQPTASYASAVTTRRAEPARKKNIIRIQDPTSGEDLTDVIFRESGAAQNTAAATVTAPPPQPDTEEKSQERARIQADFAAEVSRRAHDEQIKAPSSGNPMAGIPTEPTAVVGHVPSTMEPDAPPFKPIQPIQILQPPQQPQVPPAQTAPPVTFQAPASVPSPQAAVPPTVQAVSSETAAVPLEPAPAPVTVVTADTTPKDAVKPQQQSTDTPADEAPEQVTEPQVVVAKQSETKSTPPATSTAPDAPQQKVEETKEAPMVVEQKTKPPTETPSTVTTKPKQKRSQKMKELDKKPPKDDDMYAAFRSEDMPPPAKEEVKEEEAAPKEEISELPPEVKEVKPDPVPTEKPLPATSDLKAETEEKGAIKKKKVPTATLR